MSNQQGVVGFVGLGTMGMPMAQRLMSSGLRMVAYDRDEPAMKALAADGATCVDAPAGVGARASTVVCMLPDPATVEAVVLGAGGLASTMRPDSLIIDMSTTGPEPTKRLSAALRDKEIRIVDAPVGRGRDAAAIGDLILMVGGDETAVEDARPVLSELGSSIYHCGPAGAGQAVKLINNLVSTANLAIIAEAYSLAIASQIDVSLLADVMTNTAADSWQLRNALVRRIGEQDFEPGFKVSLAAKDLGLAISMADQLQVGDRVQCARAALDWYTDAADAGFAEQDQCAMLMLAHEADTAQ